MRIYLAGPMRGIDHYNFPAFDAATARLRGAGYRVASPAEHDRAIGFDETLNNLDTFDVMAAFRWDVDQVFDCDAVVLLPGWEKSTGVGAELAVARMIGKPIFEYGVQTGGMAVTLTAV